MNDQQGVLLGESGQTTTPLLDDALWLNEYIVEGSYLTGEVNVQTEVRQLLGWQGSSNDNSDTSNCFNSPVRGVSNDVATSRMFSSSSPKGAAVLTSRLSRYDSGNQTRKPRGDDSNQTSEPSKSARTEQAIKPRSSFLPAQTAVLQDWLDTHQEFPYPDVQDRRHLAKMTSLKEDQVNRWFTNRRARQPDPKESSPMQQNLQKDPLEAWLASSVDDEAVEDAIIQNASRSPKYEDLGVQMNRSVSRLSAGGSSSYLDHSSVSQMQHDPVDHVRRQGRKRPIWNPSTTGGRALKRKKLLPTSEPSMNPGYSFMSDEPTFYCTFPGCHVALTSKTWKRHEETKHAPRHRWVCLREGFRVRKSMSGSLTCAFCGISNPSDSHASNCSRISDCQKRKGCERTFARKDHLKQHVKNFHHSKYNEHMESWKTESDPSDKSWICGFCGEQLYGWDARALHISKHFRDGVHIKDWDDNCFDASGIQQSSTLSFFDNTFNYPYPAPTPSSFNVKPARPDLFLDIPEMTNPQSPSPVDLYPDSIITPTEPISTTQQPPLRESSAFSDTIRSPSLYPRQWTTSSPTPFITFTSDDPSGHAKSPIPQIPHLNVSTVAVPPTGDLARLEQRVFALEVELQRVRRGQSHTPESTSATLAVPSPTHGPTHADQGPEDTERVYKCQEPRCPSQGGFRYPLQLVRHERAMHHERRWQHIMRTPQDRSQDQNGTGIPGSQYRRRRPQDGKTGDS